MDFLDGAVDLHVHSAPDVTDRHQTDLELARDASEAGMRSVVVKNHVEPTASRTRLVNEAVGRDVLYGGIVLNGSVGGVNPDAVAATLSLGGRVVWLPTLWSARSASEAAEAGTTHMRGQRIPAPEEVEPISGDGTVTDAVREVIDLVAEYDAVLATGHVGRADTEAVVDACAAAGATCLVTHAFSRYLDAPVAVHEALADAGATIEYCALSHGKVEGLTHRDVADAVRRIGPDRCVLTSDYGQTGNPAVAGLRAFVEAVHDAGLPAEAVREAVCETPARLLGLD